MSGFKDIADSLTHHDDGWHVSIADNWKQGRTLYGGITTGLCYEVAQREFKDLPPLRSCQISFIGPVTDTPSLTAMKLRQGRNVTAIQVDMRIGDQSVAVANLLFGESRDSRLTITHPAPDAKAPENYSDYFPAAFKNFIPPFTHNFDIHLIDGHRPITSADQGYIRVWARHKDEDSRVGTGSFLTIGDVLPPAALPMLRQMGPVSSMNWQVNILDNNPNTEDGWWHIETTLTSANDGYSSQIMRYWNRAGTLCAEAVQSVTIFI